METGMLHLHNVVRWLIVLFAILTLAKGISGMSGKKPFTKTDKRWALFLMICADIQLLLGLYLYYAKNWFTVLTSGGAMSNKYNRFFSIEHTTGMLIGIILIHLGYAAAKNVKLPDAMRYKRMFWYTLIAIIVIAATVPWPFREEVGRPWFPGM
ncbi:MAG TPA: hypothetical protein VEB40_04840 [Flavipsychrobacter sp.]|nr:hypothetical protein [Flavipsychrobacter sp.]